MTDFLLELLSEEIPARMQARARNDLARLFAEALAAAGLGHGGLTTWSTPRRLALVARGVRAQTQAVREEIKGPRTSAPPQALDGFLRKTGLAREQIEERDGVFFAVIDRPGRPAGEVLAEAVAAIVRDFPWPKSMRWGAASASMSALRWVRPLQSVLAILGDAVLPVAVEGVQCGAATLGHRFHHPGAITIGGAFDYVEKLRACHVLVDQEERETIVRDGARAAAAAAGLALVEDEGLVVENAGLTEWPVPLLGRFDPEYLDVPHEVIVLTMRTNQKYFACTDDTGALAPAFVCTANIDANDGGAAIVEGNRRVLAARLADARFFWEQDVKVPLEEQARKLSGIVFHEKLGTVADKVERVAKLARWLCEEGIVRSSALVGEGRVGGAAAPVVDANPAAYSSAADAAGPHPNASPQGGGASLADLAERAARLCKADLVTGMVGEFPELQGVIGGYLAAAQGERREVSDAIRDHYKPVGQGDEVPTAPVTVAVSLADKLDSLAGFFAIEELPSGSKDPYALRRATISIIRTILDERLRLSISDAVSGAFALIFDHLHGIEISRNLSTRAELSEVLGEPLSSTDFDRIINEAVSDERLSVKSQESWDKYGEQATLKLLSFVADRLKVQQRSAGVRHDLIDAVFALDGEDDLVRLLSRVNALQSFLETSEGVDLFAGYKRAANILKKDGPIHVRHPGPDPGPAFLEAGEEGRRVPGQARDDALRSARTPPEETTLVVALDLAEPRAAAAVEAEDFTGAMAALASLRGPIDAFFEKVTVNDPDPAIRARRLSLLARFRDAVHRVADFSKIEG